MRSRSTQEKPDGQAPTQEANEEAAQEAEEGARQLFVMPSILGECRNHPGHNMVGCALCAIGSVPSLREVSNMIDDGTGRGCVRTVPRGTSHDDPYHHLERGRVGPFPDVGGVYGYCPACKKPQGHLSHAWIHGCISQCNDPCERAGRAIFLCQRPFPVPPAQSMYSSEV